MPTSSQAMILRGSDCYPRHRASVNFRFGNPFLENTSECETSCKQQSPSKERTEIVNFDFSVSTSPDPALNLQGFEGAFSFDEKTKSYRWHIYAVTPKEPGVTAGAECGDHNDETGAFMQRQISDTTRHFTTPAESLLDNSVSNTMEPNPNVVNIPVYGSRRVEDAAYKRLEELGFRRRTVYSPSGNLFRLKRAQSIVCSPKRCSSEQQTASESIRKLAITNLDTEGVPYQKSLAYKRTGVEPRTIITTDAIRKRAPVIKQKSLLEEVKESVNWANRISPSTHARPKSSSKRHNAVCFSLRDSGAFSHQQILNLVETQAQGKVKSLQFDPVSTRTNEADVIDRWIVTFDTQVSCERAIERGLSVGGDRVVVRDWDAILREECGLEEWHWSKGGYRLKADKHQWALQKFLNAH